MARKKDTSKNHANTQAALDVKAVEARLKEIRKHQRELLKRQGQTIREFRKEVSALKKAGVVSKRTNAALQEPTKYMRAKVRKFYDVIVGTHIPVRAKPNIRYDYSSKGIFEERGAFLMVPKETAKTKATLDKLGRITIKEQISQKTITRSAVYMDKIVLPFSATDMLDLANKLEKDPTIPSELDGNHQYAFSLFGHRSSKAFVDKQELITHIRDKYKHLFDGRSGHQAVKHFYLFTFSGGSSDIPETGEAKFYSQRGKGRKPNATGRTDRNSWYETKRMEVRAAKEKKYRASLTGEEKAAYKAKAKARAKASRERAKSNG